LELQVLKVLPKQDLGTHPRYLMFNVVADAVAGWRWGPDQSAGFMQLRKSMACALADAHLQGRTLILPDFVGMDAWSLMRSKRAEDSSWVSPAELFGLQSLESKAGFKAVVMGQLDELAGKQVPDDAVKWLKWSEPPARGDGAMVGFDGTRAASAATYAARRSDTPQGDGTCKTER
jgi:hypothetical protein